MLMQLCKHTGVCIAARAACAVVVPFDDVCLIMLYVEAHTAALTALSSSLHKIVHQLYTAAATIARCDELS
jgi:hypothetical protein